MESVDVSHLSHLIYENPALAAQIMKRMSYSEAVNFCDINISLRRMCLDPTTAVGQAFNKIKMDQRIGRVGVYDIVDEDWRFIEVIAYPQTFLRMVSDRFNLKVRYIKDMFTFKNSRKKSMNFPSDGAIYSLEKKRNKVSIYNKVSGHVIEYDLDFWFNVLEAAENLLDSGHTFAGKVYMSIYEDSSFYLTRAEDEMDIRML